MTRRDFHSFMVETELGGNAKVGRLTDAEFRCLVTGIWALAAKANPRGYLLVGELNAEPQDIAHQARSTPAIAKRTVDKMLKLGMLEEHEDGRLWVHDWDLHQPAPRKPSDDPAATRERKRKSRATERDKSADVTRDAGVTSRDPSRREVEAEENNPPSPPVGGRARDVKRYEQQLREYSSSLLPDAAPSEAYAAVRSAISLLRNHGEITNDELRVQAQQWLPSRSEVPA